MSNEKKQKVIATLFVVALMAVTIWVGIIIGRHYEMQRANRIINNMAKGVEKNNIDMAGYEAQLNYLESQIANDDKLLQTIWSIKQYYIEEIAVDELYAFLIILLICF